VTVRDRFIHRVRIEPTYGGQHGEVLDEVLVLAAEQLFPLLERGAIGRLRGGFATGDPDARGISPKTADEGCKK
jgi:hypothetical protein